MEGKPRILVLCTGNASRSQMAEALLRHMAGDRFEVLSAGTEPADEVHPLAVRVMEEAGVDMAGQRPKDLSAFLGKVRLHRLIVVCDRAQKACPSVWPLLEPGARLYWPLEDPARVRGTVEERLEAFRRTRDELRRRIAAFLEDEPDAEEPAAS